MFGGTCLTRSHSEIFSAVATATTITVTVTYKRTSICCDFYDENRRRKWAITDLSSFYIEKKIPTKHLCCNYLCNMYVNYLPLKKKETNLWSNCSTRTMIWKNPNEHTKKFFFVSVSCQFHDITLEFKRNNCILYSIFPSFMHKYNNTHNHHKMGKLTGSWIKFNWIINKANK